MDNKDFTAMPYRFPLRSTLRPAALSLLITLGLAGQALAAVPDGDVRVTPVVRTVRAVAPAVVTITSARVVERRVSPFGPLGDDDSLPPFFREFFGQGQGQRQRVTQESLGSGVIIDGDKGLVLTNAHVIAGATSITLRLQDGRALEAEAVGSNPDFDLAVLRVVPDKEGKADPAARHLPSVQMGDSADLMVGETVIAIGNPYGYNSTVTTGVVSALNRAVKTEDGLYTDFVQTDAAINPGNSGGPLLNLKGELVGVTTAIRADAQGIGFAIPINKAKKAVAELLSHGQVSPVWLGLLGQNLDQRTAGYLGRAGVRGMLVTEVFDNSPAARAGIKPGDVIETMGTVDVEDKEQFASILRNYTSGETIDLRLFRDGAQMTLKAKADPLTPEMMTSQAWSRWGIEADAGSKGNGSRGLPVRKVRQSSPAARLGLQPGDRLVQIGSVVMRQADDFLQGYARYMMQSSLLIRVERAGRLYYLKMNV
jgi:Do/DeqQ family serine protease